MLDADTEEINESIDGVEDEENDNDQPDIPKNTIFKFTQYI